MKRRISIAIVFVFLLFALLQVLRPSISSSPSVAEVHAPEDATRVLRTSCYSCHSNERRLAWFDEIVPAYWLVRHDINEARSHLNFSTLGEKPAAAQRATLFEAVNMMELGAMPLKSFAALHPEARVNRGDLENLKSFLAPWRETPAPLAEPIDLIAPSSANVAPGGLSFDASYPQWHLLSVTDRGDNNTFRFILGNDIAMKAVREGNISPWPDGVRFAKIAWQQRSSVASLIQPGEFLQIELMVKDASLYRSSEGWGWGRWRGKDLKPYGESEAAIGECTRCHAPMKKNDFVYTMPISKTQTASSDQVNLQAAETPVLPFDLDSAIPLTLYVDRGESTISVLFRRNVASKELLLVTWNWREDPHWFGARIPGTFLRAEYVNSNAAASQEQYKRIEGKASQGVAIDPIAAQTRTQFITQLKQAPFLTH